jgi:hypothetical protein
MVPKRCLLPRWKRSWKPEQLTVGSGNAVIAHHLLAHSSARNLSVQIRYAVYFRVLHRDDDAYDPAPLMSESRFFAGVPW